MESVKRLCLVAAGTLLLGVLGCGGGLVRSPGPSEEVLDLKRKIHELQRQARVDQVKIEQLREGITALEQELATVRDVAADRETVSRGPAAAEDSEVEAFPPSEPEIEETELEESEAPLAAAPPVMPPTAPPIVTPPPPPPAAPPPTAPPAAATEEALRLYDEAYSLFHQQRYDQAEERFRHFLTLYPQTDLADNAQFWIGESHYARGDFTSALEAFTSTVELYPQGNKVADALLKAGKCLEELGQPAVARQTYREITDRFPSSSAAVVARERLTGLE